MNKVITKYCQIRNRCIRINGNVVYENPDAADFSEFIRSGYKFAGMNYPKFYKMDNLCKLAMVAAELILNDPGIIEKYGKDNIGIIFQNYSSTLDTDTEFQSTIDDRTQYFPSPAVFVYTLPNIMMGEICIKHKLFGENILFIEPEFNPGFLYRHVNLLFEQNRIKAAVAGWIEQQKEHYDAFVYRIEPEDENMKFQIEHNPAVLMEKYKI